MKKPIVVIVEDDPVTQAFLTGVVSPIAEIHIADSIATGMAIMSRVECSALLLDLLLKNGEGRSVLERFRSTFKVPIVVITQLSEEEISTETLLLAGATEVLRKPASDIAVNASIRYAIARHVYLDRSKGVREAFEGVKREIATTKQEIVAEKEKVGA